MYARNPDCRFDPKCFSSLLNRGIFFTALLVFQSHFGFSQDEITYTERTFYDTRIINGHSVETNEEGLLKFIISHRFGPANNGISDFFGLDDANTRIGLDYGISRWLTIGLGRSSLERTYDGFIKTKLIRQSSGRKNFPLTITFFTSLALKTTPPPSQNGEEDYKDNLYYTYQLLLARKFGHFFSLQLIPTIIHRNLVNTIDESNDVLAIGIAPKFQISKRITINFEYHYVPADQLSDVYVDAFSIGFDIETKGHVFQITASNARGIIEKSFITETTDQWNKGEIHLGFNITRDFKLKGRKYRKPK